MATGLHLRLSHHSRSPPIPIHHVSLHSQWYSLTYEGRSACRDPFSTVMARAADMAPICTVVTRLGRHLLRDVRSQTQVIRLPGLLAARFASSSCVSSTASTPIAQTAAPGRRTHPGRDRGRHDLHLLPSGILEDRSENGPRQLVLTASSFYPSRSLFWPSIFRHLFAMPPQ